MLPFQGDGYWKNRNPPRCGGLGYVAPCGAKNKVIFVGDSLATKVVLVRKSGRK
jgi:hypothetical protein